MQPTSGFLSGITLKSVMFEEGVGKFNNSVTTK